MRWGSLVSPGARGRRHTRPIVFLVRRCSFTRARWTDPGCSYEKMNKRAWKGHLWGGAPWVNGAQRAGGRAGETVARNGRSSSPCPKQITSELGRIILRKDVHQAWKDQLEHPPYDPFLLRAF